jgi:hypothetical protein
MQGYRPGNRRGDTSSVCYQTANFDHALDFVTRGRVCNPQKVANVQAVACSLRLGHIQLAA